MKIKSLLLDNFRNHKILKIDKTSKFNFIIGDNGIGKTNVVEALSMFSPGKGLRSTSLDEMVLHNAQKWTVFGTFANQDDDISIGSEYRIADRRRSILIDAKSVKSSDAILKYVRIMWLLPHMDYLLSESKTSRRKFFDRITYNFFPGHAILIKQYEIILKSRLKLLKSNNWDEILITQYEKMLTEFSAKIIKNRMAALDYINEAKNQFTSNFLKPSIHLVCECVKHINGDFNSFMSDSFRRSRALDAKIGRSMFGIHRADYNVINTKKNVGVKFCSTGEQKAMLISILIAQIMVLNSEFNIAPILILDDIFSHLDANRVNELLAELSNLDAQIWVTTTYIDQKAIELQCKEYIKIKI
ncbi:MAG: DNA replication/repair protein RecF [Alphaproteobacteria bacterium]|jgi:DNA replication and repair protein RecF|nr:DNA replication and repair protein RecF [Candidatus Jidaibacter sp.]